MSHAYRLNSTRASSAKYGPCEVCRRDASEVFIFTRYKRFTRPDGIDGLTRMGDLFGHKACLSKQTD